MSRGSRLRILLGACIVGGIGVLADSNLLIAACVILLILSSLRYRSTPTTNYTEKFGPPDSNGSETEGFGSILLQGNQTSDQDDAEESQSSR